jgi:signal transduction histidine kinase/Tfp pilus assembly protein PilF
MFFLALLQRQNKLKRLLLFTSILYSFCCFGIKSNTDSLLKAVSKSNDTGKVNIYNQLANEISNTNPSKSLEYSKKAYELSFSINFKKGTAFSLKNMASIYNEIGNYPKAFEYAIKAQKLFLETDNKTGQARTLNLIGIINDNIGNTKEAIEYYKKSFTLFKKLNDLKGQAGALNNISIIYFKKNKFDEAIIYLKKSLKLNIDAGNERGISACYNNMGGAYKSKKEYDKALDYFQKALALKEKIGDPGGIGICLTNIGSIYNAKGEYVKALEYFTKSLDYNSTVSALSDMADTYKAMGEAYAGIGNYPKAYINLTKYSDLKDTLTNQENIKKIDNLQLRFEAEVNEKEIELLKQKDEVNSLKIQRQSLLRNLLIIGILLTIALAIMFFTRYRNFRKTNKVLRSQKQKISKSNKELVSMNENITIQKQTVEELNAKLQVANAKLSKSEKNLMKLNATKDKLFSLISHDLRNPFASIISFSRIMKRDINKFSKKEIKELSLELDKSVNRISDLLDNLLWWSRAQTGRIVLKTEDLLLNEVIKENLESLVPFAEEKEISIINDTDPDILVFADWNILSTILRNLITNAIKFSKNNTSVRLVSERESGFAKISVIDQGVGIKEENFSKLFHVESTYTTFGTNDEKGSGLGLILCKEFTEILGGRLIIQSEPDKGTTVSITLPLSK